MGSFGKSRSCGERQNFVLFFKKSFMDMSVLTPWDEMSRMKSALLYLTVIWGRQMNNDL